MSPWYEMGRPTCVTWREHLLVCEAGAQVTAGPGGVLHV